MAGSSRSLGSLTLDLIARIAGFTGPLDKAGRELDAKGRAMEKRGKAIGLAIGAAITAGLAAATTIAAGIQLSINRMDDLSKAAQRVQLPTEQFSQLAYAGDLADVSVQDLESAFGKLQKAQGASNKDTSAQAKIFKALGIEVKNADGTLRDALPVFYEFADRFKQLEGSPESIAAGMAIFGESFRTIIPLIKDGSQGLKDAAAEADNLGVTLSTEAGQNAEKFNDDITRLKSAVKGFWQEIAEAALPQLDRFSGKMVEYATNADEAHDASNNVGQAIGNIADAAGAAIPKIAALINRLSDASVEIDTFRFSVNRDINTSLANLLPGGSIRDFLKKQADEAQQKVDEANGIKIDVPVTILPKLVVTGNLKDFAAAEANRIKESNKLQAAINAALGPTPKAAKSSHSSGKSDAKKAAEEAARAAKEARDELEKQVKAVADAKEGFEQYAAQLAGPVADANYQYAQSQQKLIELAKTGEISTQELTKVQEDLTKAHTEDLKSIDDRLNPGKQLIEDIKEQTMLLGLNNDQQEIYNNLKYAGKDANEAMRESITQATLELQKQRESTQDQIDIMDGLRDSAKTFFDDLKDGVGVWDSLKDAAGNFADILYDIASRKLIEQIFGQAGTTGSGSSGGGWLDALVGLFSSSGSSGFGGEGSPLASGGWTNPSKFHQVGEYDRPEMLFRNGKQYLIPGDKGRVEPMGASAGGFVQNMSFPVLGRTDNRSLKQVRQAAGEGAAAAIRSNRGGR